MPPCSRGTKQKLEKSASIWGNSWSYLIHTNSHSSHVLLSAQIPRETDRYAPWVEATNIALQILKTVDVDDIREPSHLNILAQRNDPNEVTICHGSDESYRKPDVVFMTEKELTEVHEINTTASDWRTALFKLCQLRLPTQKDVKWKQFKATAEFKRNKSSGPFIPPAFPEELRSCRDGTSYFIRPQILGDVDDTPEGAGGDPVPRACTSCFRSFLFQILTRFSYKPAARNGFEAVLTHVVPRDQ
jgi:hypothetical protein